MSESLSQGKSIDLKNIQLEHQKNTENTLENKQLEKQNYTENKILENKQSKSIDKVFSQIRLNKDDKDIQKLKSKIKDFFKKMNPNLNELKKPDELLAQYIVETLTCPSIKQKIYNTADYNIQQHFNSKRKIFEHDFKKAIEDDFE